MKQQKKYTEAQLQEKAEKVFKDFTKAKVVYATTDGNIFLSKNYAEMHAGIKGKISEFERQLPTLDDSDNPKNLTALETIALIKESDFDGLAIYSNDKRSTVKKAYKERLEELNEWDLQQTIVLIQESNLEDLAKYTEDERESVQFAYKKRLKELGVTLNEEE